jgi:hypothetical protein
MCQRAKAKQKTVAKLQYHNAKETAEILCTSIQRLANLRFAGQGPAYSKIGTAIRYELGDIQKFMDSKKVVPAQEVE